MTDTLESVCAKTRRFDRQFDDRESTKAVGSPLEASIVILVWEGVEALRKGEKHREATKR
jgi:hypothetical protein